MRRLLLAALPLALAALTGCSGDDAAAQADCLDATDYGPAIAEGAKGPKITPGDAQAVQSGASDLYYVAMNFIIDGDDETGVWLTSTLDPAESGSILAVDAMAKTVTDAAEACLD